RHIEHVSHASLPYGRKRCRWTRTRTCSPCQRRPNWAGQKYCPRRPATATRDGCNGPTTRPTRFSTCVDFGNATNAFLRYLGSVAIKLAAAKLDSTERICRQRGTCV